MPGVKKCVECVKLKFELQQALDECARLREQNEQLRVQLSRFRDHAEPLSLLEKPPLPADSTLIAEKSPSDVKIALFRSLFKGREDVFAERWEKKGSGTPGYSWVCARKWDRLYCNLPNIKCAYCDNKEYSPLTDRVIEEHLRGIRTVGIYPLLQDETCWFLAVDFDKETCRDDAIAFVETCHELGVPAALERSRRVTARMYGYFLRKQYRLRLPAIWDAPS